MTHTVAALYDNYASAEAAVRDLESNKISHDDISIIANHSEEKISEHLQEGNEAGTGAGAGAAFGAIIGGGSGLMAGLGMLAIPGIGPVVAAGWLAAAAAGAVTGAVVAGAGGGLIGAMIGAGIPEAEANVYAEGVRRGGTLVTVRVDDSQQAFVNDILRRHKAADAHERARVYSESGWTRFDEKAPPYTPNTIDSQRLHVDAPVL